MAKECGYSGCNNPVFSHGFCRYHQNKRTDEKWLKKLAVTRSSAFRPKKPRKPIPRVSQKMLDALAIYRVKKKKYMAEHPMCEVQDCEKRSTNLHHKMGRERNKYADQWARDNGIPLLSDERFFMACCETCHPKRIHENPEWAYKHGYLLKRDL